MDAQQQQEEINDGDQNSQNNIYQHTQEDIEKYAVFLGMDIEKDKEFLYIAKQGLDAPIPEPWEAY